MITPSFGLTATERVLPRMALDFTTAALDPRVTFTRTGNTATVVNSVGQIAPINADLPRFDYNLGTGGACNGLLIEEARTNLLLNGNLTGSVDGSPGTAPTGWSIAFGTGAFTTKTNSVYGTLDGAQAIRFDATATQRIMYSQNVVVTSGVQYAVSFYVEAVSGSPGDVGFAASGTTTATMNSFVTNPTTGKKSFLFTANGTGTIGIRIGIGTSAGAANTCSVTVSRIQVEAGAFATSYIPTVATTVTRNADVAVMTGTNFSDWYNAAEGTIQTQCTLGYTGNFVGFPYPISINDNSGNNEISLFGVDTSTQTVISMRVGGVDQLNYSFGSWTAGTNKVAIGYKQNNTQLGMNASAKITDTLCNVPTVNQMQIGRRVAGNTWTGHIQKVNFWPQRLIASELAAFTK